MKLDLDLLLKPISEEYPSGTNLEYDTEFLELQEALKGKEERQYGDVIIPAEEPDWNKVHSIAEQLINKSKDIRVYMAFLQSQTVLYGLEGFKEACELFSVNLSTYWDTIFPTLEEDGDYDSVYRLNAFSALANVEGVLKQLKECELVSSGLTQTPISVKDAEDILTNSNALGLDYPGGKERLILDLKIGYDENKGQIGNLVQAVKYLEDIQSTVNEHLGETTLSLDVLLKLMNTFKHFVLLDVSGVDLSNKDELITHNTLQREKEQENLAGLNASSQNVWRTIKLSNRDEVNLVLEKVCIYFESKEPSHPAPLFIRRVQRLMDMNFYEIVRNISPESLSNLDNLIGDSNSESGGTGDE